MSENNENQVSVENEAVITEVKTLKQCLDVNNIQKITKFKELKKYFDVKNLGEDGSPEIETEQKTVIIFDHSDFNSTYMIDLINQYIEDHPAITDNTVFLYCDDFLTRVELFEPKRLKSLKEDNLDNDLAGVERDILKPGLLIINPFEFSVDWFPEPFTPFTIETVDKVLTQTKIFE